MGLLVSQKQDRHQNQQKLTGAPVSSPATNYTSSFHLLPSCAGCLTLNINSTIKSLDQALKLLKLDLETGLAEITAQSVYLLGRTSRALLQTAAPPASCD